jgi:hypothetical protein
VGVYFTEVEGMGATKYVPRSVQIDLEDGVCNRVSIQAEHSVTCVPYSNLIRSYKAERWENSSGLIHL